MSHLTTGATVSLHSLAHPRATCPTSGQQCVLSCPAGGASSSRISSPTVASFSDGRKVQKWMEQLADTNPGLGEALLPGGHLLPTWNFLGRGLGRECGDFYRGFVYPPEARMWLGGHPGLVPCAWIPGRWCYPFLRSRGLLCDRSLMVQKGMGDMRLQTAESLGIQTQHSHVSMNPNTPSSGISAPPCPGFLQ